MLEFLKHAPDCGSQELARFIAEQRDSGAT
jgi:hypothetical protein